MQCSDVTAHLAEYLAGTLPDAARDELRAHLAECESCRAEVDEADELWQLLGALPAAPADSDGMRTRFEAVLSGYVEGARHNLRPRTWRPSSTSWAPPLWSPARAAAMALSAAALMVLGVVLGRQSVAAPAADPQYSELRQELREMRQLVTLSLLRQRSASDRLTAVSWSERIDEPGAEVLSALLDTLTHDTNVNVRLATVEALRRFAERETVRSGVVDAFDAQTSPLVQIAVIDFLVEAEGPRSASLLMRLSEDPRLDEAVRTRAARGLQ